ncbi:DUF4397 domain-containing protein [Cryobacterium sp. 10I1]|uniref:DUF4397 domain-containing protein n=3 Tax=Bacteria TaxID=2 RepID=UPI002AC972E9|nr:MULTISPECIES: DUF4397 domain-containing protein [unclassified Cryobacterium]MEB0004264.1 DUF4397 domain-containing protein [Cryobacterium sp. RTC2.1]MEB0201546.1 DUF4397 domain-containing protein [Cryobacterium sp. 5I3]MEB0284979.1 DUF4397 domain-containing protein [Cryobacterium sp. 10S3]MEB0306802.1 DUF4397 domain-containing protein [Cryobacterium sp. 10I1]WPX14014.1 DUF4397 domain-containing protein [Cryobacterium sp. 10S3]
MRKILAVGAAAGVLVALAGFGPAYAGDGGHGHGSGDNGPAELTVFHGIPGVTVDVYVDGALTLDDFTPGSFSDTLSLDPGTYSVAITAADAADASSPVIGPVDLSLKSGDNYTAVAHLTEAGEPTATLFTNNPDSVGKGKGRLTVRHVAAAPSVDVLANGAAAITDLTNPDEVELTLPTGTISAAVAATGTTDPLLGPADVSIAKRTNTIVYAYGSLADGTLALAVQTVPLEKGHWH